MKLIYENISDFLKKQTPLLLVYFFISVITRAQTDTIAAPMTDNDSAITIEQNDTIYERTDYFEKNSINASPDTIHLRQVPGEVIDSLKKDDAFWYADYVLKKQKAKAEEIKTRDIKPPSRWMNMTTLVVILVIFLVILAWYLYKNNIIRKTPAITRGEKEEEIANEDIFSINYEIEIEKAISTADYRLAIRLMFLRALKNLAGKNIIQYKQDRTNLDYLAQLSSTGYYPDFFRLTRNYEYTWYGKFDLSREAFTIIKNEFENFEHRLP